MPKIPRKIDKDLLAWKNSSNRKVLLLRGARQVGKTHSVRMLAESFPSFLEVNFFENPEIKQFFSGPLSPKSILEKLGAYFGISIHPGKTLVFFDEIQECQEALNSLRFFYEKLPELHLLASGSLLEFAISEIPSFGVGRITSLFLYPLNFEEFLTATNNDSLLQIIKKASAKNPLAQALHAKCLELLRTFMIIGGLPEVVTTYLESRDLLVCNRLHDSLYTSYQDDFAKYRKRIPAVRLNEAFRSVVAQAGNKFIYSRISSEEPGRNYKEALDLLVRAGLVYKIFHTSANGIPLGAEANLQKFKVIPFDTGLYNNILGLALDDYLTKDNARLVNEGAIAEIFAGLELLSQGNPYTKGELFYWHREARGSNAEIDYVIQDKRNVIPLEVKAGTKGQMQSMHLFLERKNYTSGIRLSLENFSAYDSIKVIPLYAISEIERLSRV